jgi:hypothetical protein
VSACSDPEPIFVSFGCAEWLQFHDDDSFWGKSYSRERRQASFPTDILCLPKKLGLPVLGEGRCQDANVNSQQLSGDTGCAGVSGAPNQVCAVSPHSYVFLKVYILSSKLIKWCLRNLFFYYFYVIDLIKKVCILLVNSVIF